MAVVTGVVAVISGHPCSSPTTIRSVHLPHETSTVFVFVVGYAVGVASAEQSNAAWFVAVAATLSTASHLPLDTVVYVRVTGVYGGPAVVEAKEAAVRARMMAVLRISIVQDVYANIEESRGVVLICSIRETLDRVDQHTG